MESEDLEVATIVDDPSFDGYTPPEILAARRRGTPGPDTWSFCFVADQVALETAGFPVLAVPVDQQLQSFRVMIRHLSEVVFPLAVRTMDWDQFSDRLDQNGVYRSLHNKS